MAKVHQGGACLRREASCFAARAIETNNRRISRFGGGGIFAGSLAEFLGRLRYIENVVDDLKGKAERLTEPGERFEPARKGVGAHRSESDCGSQQRCRFCPMNKLQLTERSFPAFAFEIEHLTRNEPPASGGMREFRHQGRRRIAFRRGCGRKNFESHCQERIPREHGNSFAENFVICGASASKIVVVHARQIIVNQRIGVHTLDCACGRYRSRQIAAARFRRGEQQNGPKSFSTRKQAVTHCGMNGSGTRPLRRQCVIQRAIHEPGPGAQIRLQRHRADFGARCFFLATAKPRAPGFLTD